MNLRAFAASPARAFGSALLVCSGYFAIVFAVAMQDPAGSRHLGLASFLLLLGPPALASAALVAAAPMSRPSRGLRRAAQAAAAAIVAPLLSWYGVGLAFVVLAGDGS